MPLEFFLMKLVDEENLEKIKEIIWRDPAYTFDRGLMALSIALKWERTRHIGYEMLSPPGAWEHYVASQFSPFIVLDELEELVKEYKRCNGYQIPSH